MSFFFNRQKTPSGSYDNEYELLDEPIYSAMHIPLRLNPKERKVQRLMRGIILASCYTDKVDSTSAMNLKRDMIIVRELINIFSGLIIGLDFSSASTLLRNKEFAPYSEEVRTAIETCRRYKIMNPDLMRTDYVKFLYMVQDAVQNVGVRDVLSFDAASELVTVGSYCEELGVQEILKDSRLPLCITPIPPMANRTVLNKCLRYKDVMVNKMVKEYAQKHQKSEESIEVIIRSLNDANCFSNDNAKTTEELLGLLRKYFHPTQYDDLTNLAIEEGTSGSRISHTHARQYSYVVQSLSLWKAICSRMYMLWTIAESDMLNPEEKYELRFTGQGLQRVQKAPKLFRAIEAILKQTKEEVGEWVGSERIHLGDDQVPNAFYFIDKYGQVSRILVPILRTLNKVDELMTNRDCAAYITDVWGSAVNAKVAILGDFFRHGFDGSGGDNMEDAGSCIDGRLTSAWNWCNNIRFKTFYPLFLWAGFSSFDGEMST
ncbi:unnamed protein product [Phytomonas sp. EM1]|nr:unnamed protein product [Phytomonas sp. EM1]|eukprot:CCW61388.1 unnamed protein product [Phytomonas sp. isolate EM1]